MSTKYAAFIKTLRIKKGFLQSLVASKLGISRPSYIALEHGKRELTFAEAERLADLYGISIAELEMQTAPNEKKYKEMLLEFLRLIGKREGLKKTKLAKLLYLSDFAWFYDHAESMSGMPYRRIKYGPVPDTYFRALEELTEEGMITITETEEGAMIVSPTRISAKTSAGLLSREEKELIKNIAEKWKTKNTAEIVAFTHNQLPYKICADGEIIPYSLIVQEDPENVY
jgi:transcriptional regulator with XRE-family HTH domain